VVVTILGHLVEKKSWVQAGLIAGMADWSHLEAQPSEGLIADRIYVSSEFFDEPGKVTSHFTMPPVDLEPSALLIRDRATPLGS
jgi:hypothetical protein